MSLVFADAFYFVARLNRHDQFHRRVVEFTQTFRARLVTTDWVLMEVADALSKSNVRNRIRDFILHLRQSAACEVVAASRELHDRALEYYHQRADKDWTLTDCISFVIMEERGLRDALTGDRHFEQAGFNALLK